MSGSTYRGKMAAPSHALQSPGKTLHRLAVNFEGSTSLADILEGLRAAMNQNLSRALDLFRDIDRDGSGTVSKAEFTNVAPLIGLGNASADLVDALFGLLDSDGSGLIDYRELMLKLKGSPGTTFLSPARRPRRVEMTAYYCTPFCGEKDRPLGWHDVRGKTPPGDRLLRSPPPRSRPAPSPRCSAPRPPPEPVPLLARTTSKWAVALDSPRGMRIPLRPVPVTTSYLGSTTDKSVREVGAGTAESEEMLSLPPTPWRKLHARPDLNSPSSEYGKDVPSTPKARARRMAAVIHQLPRVRAKVFVPYA